jgi:hypothetical protein
MYCLFFVDLLILITSLVSFGHCIVCSSSIYWFWLLLWYLLAIVLSVEQTIQWPKDTEGAILISKSTKNRQYHGQKIPKGQSESVNWWRTDNTMAKWFFVDLLILIAPLVSFDHCIVCCSSIDWFWLPLWYLLAFVLSEQTIQWPKDTKKAIRINKSTRNRQYNGQKIPKG